MRNDDDDDPTMGNVYQSGIDPNPGRADYALPPGTPALEGEEPEFEAITEDSETGRDRRHFLFLGFALGAGLATTSYLAYQALAARSKTDPKSQRSKPRPPWADDIVAASRVAADGSLDELLAGHPTFLMVTGAFGGSDPKLWEGVVRLATFARLDRSEKGFQLASRLLEMFKVNAPPARYAFLAPEMELIVTTWRSNK